MIKNIILDRDGIINEVVIRGNIISSPWKLSEFTLLEESKEFLKKISKNKFRLFVATNQPDLKRGNLKFEDFEKMNSIVKKNLNIEEIFYCPHDDSDKCNCRKPLPGMLENILLKYSLEKKETCMIGDSIKDILAAEAAGIESFFLNTDYNTFKKTKDIKRSTIVNSFIELEYALKL